VDVQKQELFERRYAEVFASAIEILAYIMTEVVLSRPKSFWKVLLQGQDSEFANLQTTFDLKWDKVKEVYSLFKSSPPPLETIARNERENTFHDPLIEIDRARVPGTGSWLEQEHNYQEWMHRRISLLWMHGPLGFGKTFLAASVVSNLKASKKTPFFAYAFFSKTHKSRSVGILYDALDAMVEQLSQANTEYKSYVNQMRQTSRMRETASSLWREMFVGYFMRPDAELFLVLDGVDEIGETNDSATEELFKLLHDLRSKFVLFLE
jgi:hypothetical protein